VTRFTKEELRQNGVDEDLSGQAGYVPAAGIIEDVDLFDAGFFGYTPMEAMLLDPQQRLFLEAAWTALEHAGCDPQRFPGPIGVFAGSNTNRYLLNCILPRLSELSHKTDLYSILLLNEKDFLPSRVSYKLNLRGPSISVQTACSTSLVAVHQACQSLINGECDMALAGGVGLMIPQKQGYLYKEGMILSPDGYCRAFDAEAAGTVGGSGLGIVVLKRLDDALQDGDTIHAVILGSAVNNDGSDKVGYTAPSVSGQAAVIKEAIAVAGVHPEQIGFVETHGTGTRLGDPVEIAALTRAFRENTGKRGFCAIGSVKTNIGHLDAAAGIAGLIKAAFAVRHGLIPPSLHFHSPNQAIPFEETPFYVNDALSPWPRKNGPRVAGVSSFGMGGTNAHLVLTQGPQVKSEPSARASHILLLSAKTEEALERQARDLADYLENAPETNLADTAYTLALGRGQFEHRLAVTASTTGEAAERLRKTSGKIPEGAIPYEDLLHQWLQGEAVEWDRFFEGEKRLRIPLPGYPFERSRYWLDPPGTRIGRDPVREPDPSQWFYEIKWVKQEILPLTTPFPDEPWLVFADTSGLGEAMVRSLRERGLPAGMVRPGETCLDAETGSYVLDPADPEAFRTLIRQWSPGSGAMLRIVHLWGCDDHTGFDRVQEHGLFSLLYLVQALDGLNASILTVSHGTEAVTGKEAIDPSRATVHGLCRTVHLEHPNLVCAHVDLDDPGPRLASDLIAEALHASSGGFSAFRTGLRYERVYGPYHPTARPGRGTEGRRLRDRGVYLITGGLGGVGLVFAEYLARKARACLVLTNRSGFPAPEEWDRYLRDIPAEDRVGGAIRKIRELEELGARVLVLQADVADPGEMSRAVTLAEERFGPINGVVHCAGHIAEGTFPTLKETTPSTCRTHFAPKVHGLMVLDELFSGHEVDFFCLTSSLSAVLGGIGLGAYAAANAYMDAFAAAKEITGRGVWTSVNWDGWKTGNLKRSRSNPFLEALAITPEEGLECLDRVFAREAPSRLLVSTAPLERRLQYMPPPMGAKGHQKQVKGEAGISTVGRIADIWSDVIGIHDVGPETDFFEAGGHSLMATQVLSRIREEFDQDIPLQFFLSNPTLSALAREVDRLAGKETIDLEPSPRTDPLPLSFAQERLWFLDRLDPGRPVYNIPFALRLRGEFDRALFTAAVNDVVQRHEILRTHFEDRDGRPIQVVEKRGPLPVTLIDLTSLDPARRLEEAAGRVRDQSRKPFDLNAWPLITVQVLKLDREDHILSLCLHHAITDGWSMSILLEEISEFYRAAGRHQAPDLAPLPPQYADFAILQRRDLEQGRALKQFDYWKRSLEGMPSHLDLPTDFPRPRRRTGEGSYRLFDIDKNLTEILLKAAKGASATPFMVILAALYILLRRYTNKTDICIGFPIAGRNRRVIEKVVGLFVNTLPLRINLPEETTFSRILRETRKIASAAYDNQDIPFERIVEAVSPERDLGQTPLFQVVLAFQNLPELRLSLGKTRVAPFAVDYGTAKFDLTFFITEGGKELTGALEYDTALFTEVSAQKICDHLLNILRGALENPEADIRDLPILTEAEIEARAAINRTDREIPPELLHTLFTRRAHLAPNHIALRSDVISMTYAELLALSARIGRRLRQEGALPNTLVAVVMEKGWEQAPAVMGVLMSGAAYLPIDAGFPADRIHQLLKQGEAAIVLTQTKYAEAVEWPEGLTVLTITRDAFSHLREVPPKSVQTETDLAYVIFTSGSTGAPKGVMIDHRGAVNTILDINSRFSVDERDRVLAISELNFDLSVWDIFGTLAAGGAIVYAGPDDARDPMALADRVAREGITIWNSVPAFVQLFAEHALEEDPDRYRTLRLFMMSGDWIPPTLPGRVRTHLPDALLISMGGATEASIWSIIYPIHEVQPWWPSIPYGRPMVNQRFYILDQRLEPVPDLVQGDLYIGGRGLALGYWKNREITEKSFVIHSRTHERLYRTGDKGRFIGRGETFNIEFMGRKDHQVKIRGFRIETGEIESVLAGHPAIKHALVMARNHGPGGKRLVAYVVPVEGSSAGADELKAFLRAKLPEYMVPPVYMQLDALPLTPNGKIDRSGLPDPGADALSDGLRAPRTPAEKVLAEIWQQVLGLSRVGIDDNFFEKGGDSILSIQIVSRASKAGIPIRPLDIFQHQTIRELAAVAGGQRTVIADQHRVQGEIPLTPIQQWWAGQDLAEPDFWNQAVLLHIRPGLETPRLEEALGLLLEQHDMLRAVWKRSGGLWQQILNLETVSPVVSRVDLKGLSEERKASQILRVSQALQSGLDLSSGRLCCAAHFLTGEETDRLFMAIHHLVVDAVSWSILLEDLDRFLAREPAAAKTTSYKTWALRLLDLAGSKTMEAHQDYWIGQTANVTLQALPFDGPGGENIESSARTVKEILRSELTVDLMEKAHSAYHTRGSELLLSALGPALSAWAGRDNGTWSVNLETHGREALFEDVDFSRTAGWFTAIYPVLLDGSCGQDPGERIMQTKEALRAAQPHGIAYGLIRTHGEKETGRALARMESPIGFNYLGKIEAPALTYIKGFAEEDTGMPYGPANRRPHAIDLNLFIRDGRLHILFSFSQNRFRAETIEGLCRLYVRSIEEMTGHCLSEGAGGFTPSDFPLASLDQPGLDALVDTYPDIEDIYPLSPVQQGLLFHSLMEPGTGIYVNQLRLTMEGLDVGAFERACRTVAARAPVLRTAVVWQGIEDPLQVVMRSAPLPVTRLDFSGMEAEQRRARLDRLCKVEFEKGFELDAPPLMRLHLIRLDSDLVEIVMTIHHIITDGWSTTHLLNRVFADYEALRRGEDPGDWTGFDYRDYIRHLSKYDKERAMNYWREHLAGAELPTRLYLPAENLETTGPFRREDIENSLPESLASEIDGLCRAGQVTLSSFVQAAWSLVLSRFSHEQDLTFGVTVAGRSADLPGIEEMLGLFINTLPMRATLDPDEPLRDFLSRLQERNLLHREHELSSLTDIRDLAGLPGDNPLFESILVYENYPFHEMADNQKRLGIIKVRAEERNNYPLTLFVLPGKPFLFRMSYDADRFGRSSMEAMLSCLARTIHSMAEQIDGRVRDVAGFDPLDALAAHDRLNNGARPYPGEKCVHELIREQTMKGLEKTAVVFEGKALTYGELESRSNGLALRLMEQGVGPGTCVGVCLERSLSLPVALLAVLKSGAAYVPMDPAYPPGRILHMMTDSGAGLLLTESSLAETLPVPAGIRTLLLDRDGAGSPEGPPREILEKAAGPEDLAYVIYTSGSTGQPKGVAVEHRALTNFLWSMKDEPGFSGGDTLLAVTTVSFDISGLELYLPLLCGGALELVSRETAMDGRMLADRLARSGATVMQATPSTWRMLVASGWEPEGELKILCGGETLSPELKDALCARSGSVWNLYGPTETTIWSTCQRVHPDQPVSIGYPIANTRIYLLDPYGHVLPEGIVGELCIGGHGLARGYLRRADLTREKFIPAPSFAPGERIYRTGDLARLLPGGPVELLGRRDQQVKIRGFRIEPAEIETALAGLTGVAGAVVAAGRDRSGENRLVAYVVAEPGHDLTARTLREALSASLPAFMLPAVFVPMEALPLTPNQKVDRKALPEPKDLLATGAPFVPPRNETEEKLCGIWAELLEAERVGIHDNFFDLGGHSLLAMRLIFRIAETFGIPLGIRDVFECDSPAALAARLDEGTVIARLPSSRDLAVMDDEELTALISDLEA
ncbi:MAG: amino acid adenylation domain-containing protein, partial [Pseudomonadota bacterium]